MKQVVAHLAEEVTGHSMLPSCTMQRSVHQQLIRCFPCSKLDNKQDGALSVQMEQKQDGPLIGHPKREQNSPKHPQQQPQRWKIKEAAAPKMYSCQQDASGETRQDVKTQPKSKARLFPSWKQ
jgi:hypothetical protein